MDIRAWEGDNYYYFWKPHGIPSTFGSEISYLNYLIDNSLNLKNFFDDFEDLKDYIKLEKYNLVLDPTQIVKNQLNLFGIQGELGLLNRLDNDTAGFLYFAKDKNRFDLFKSLQKENKIRKYYIAKVKGEFKQQKMIIDYPIMHHGYSQDRMITIKSPDDIQKGRGKIHEVFTEVDLYSYDKEKDISILAICIYRGIRHQIRTHLASIGHPILGDNIYGNKKTANVLQLWSVGIQVINDAIV